MKLNCPQCGQLVPADNIYLATGWATCPACNELIRLADVVPGFTAGAAGPAEPKPPRPFDAQALLERTPQRLLVHVPARGMKGGLWALLGFGVFWLTFVAFWTAGALGILFGGQVQAWNLGFAAFSIPFWLVGFGMLGGVLFAARAEYTVRIDASFLLTQVRCLFWRRRKVIDRSQVQGARPAAVLQSGRPSPASEQQWSVEIVFEKGTFRLPCQNREEQAWLIAEINDFLQTVPYRPAPFPSLYEESMDEPAA